MERPVARDGGVVSLNSDKKSRSMDSEPGDSPPRVTNSQHQPGLDL